MSRTVSASSNKAYGVARVVVIWDLPRSSFYAARHRERNPRGPRKRGPKVLSDAELLSAIRAVLDEAVFDFAATFPIPRLDEFDPDEFLRRLGCRGVGPKPLEAQL